MEIPVYLFAGFLESGKTKFMQETLEDKRFHKNEKTLVLVCEEGIEEFDPSRIPSKDIHFEVIRQNPRLPLLWYGGRGSADCGFRGTRG